jgi:small-conductance mechanosensitive channel
MQVLKQLQIPYSFAKRHGVLLRYEGDQAFIVRRESTPLLALQEARRFLGVAAQHQLCSDEEFHQLLSSSYAGDSGESQQVAAGILTVALGFASQTSASNLISGLFLIGEGSFEIGDTISITLIRGNTIEGEVISIDLLSVKLLTQDNIYVRLPNEQLIRAPVHNLSKFPIRRIPITLAINFHENIIKVREVLIDVANKYPLVLADPKPAVTVTAFRESSIELLFAVWCQQEHFLQVRDEMQERIRNGFLDNQIEIPVPKMGFVDHPLSRPLSNEEIDQYANAQALKREPNIK